MFLSIIIPVYNVEKYVRQCLDSVVTQSFKDVEIIVVNDGSTDKSGEICEEYAAVDPRIRVIHQQNVGMSVARNAGLDVATGDYIWFIDSDDWIVPNAFELLVQHLKNTNVEALSFSYILFFSENETFSEPQNIQEISVTDGNSFIRQSAFFFTAVWSFVYKREFFNEHSLRFKKGLIHEDDYFNLECFGKLKRIQKIPVALLYYRRRKDSVTGSVNPENLENRISGYIELIALCQRITDIDSDYIQNKIKAYKRVILSVLETYILTDLPWKQKYLFVKSIRKTIKVSVEKGDFSMSKIAWLKKQAYNFHPLAYMVFVHSFLNRKKKNV
jgi:glycosyltransferase involved in cell wall biosynthesis